MNDNEYKNCPYCDEKIKEKAIKCRYCHSFLNEDSIVESNLAKQIGSEETDQNQHVASWGDGIYIGEIEGGVPHGQGKLTSADGHIYAGAWVNGQKHGQGILTYPSGAKYIGEWQEDNLYGAGKMVYAEDKDIFSEKAHSEEADSEKPSGLPLQDWSVSNFSGYGRSVIEKMRMTKLPRMAKIRNLQELFTYLLGLGQASLPIRACYGALAAIIAGLVITWISGLILVSVLTAGLDPDYAAFSKVFTPNLFYSYAIVHGAPYSSAINIAALGMAETVRITLRAGSLLFLVIPFIAIFIVSLQSAKLYAPLTTDKRLRLALWQGLFYGGLVTILILFFGGIVKTSFTVPTGFTDIGVTVKGGFYFFRTLLLTTLWGCLFSLVGILHSEMKFNYSRLIERLRYEYRQGLASALKVIKINFVIALVGTILLLLWFLTDDNYSAIFLEAWWLIPFALIQLFPMAVLVIQGAPFEAGVFTESFYFSLWRGYGFLPNINWEWYFLILMLIPIMLSFIGGFTSQKISRENTKPWQSALYFSLFYSGLSFLLFLVSQISISANMGSLGQMMMEFGGGQAGFSIFLGKSVFSILFSVFLFSFLPGLLGAYYYGPSKGVSEDVTSGSSGFMETAEYSYEVSNNKRVDGFEAEEIVINNEPAQEPVQKQACIACAKDLKEGAKFCTDCGQPQN